MRLIDADALIERLKAWDTNDATDKALYNFALNRVLEAPTVEPQRKKGKWEWNGFNIQCSECGAMPDFDSTIPLYSFCPSCGAEMEGAE